jgi:hypothetical protein
MRHCKALAAVLAAAFAISGAGFAQDFMAEPGAPAAAFPKPARPVAAIVSPIWHDEDERDAAGEPDQLIRLLGIKSGMTVADIGAGSGYYVVRLSPDRRRRRPRYRARRCSGIFAAAARAGARSRIAERHHRPR